MAIDGLLQSLSQYSPEANQVMQAMAAALRPVGLILIGLFFLIELTERMAELKLEGGVMTPRLFGELAFNYLIALILVWQSQAIFNAMLEVGNMIMKRADSVIPPKEIISKVEITGIKGFIFKSLFKAVAQFTQWLAGIIVNILIMIRYYQMYIAGTIAPVIVAFFVNRSLRSISVNFLKLFGSYALQGVIILVIVRIYPYLVVDDILKISSTGLDENFMNAFASIAKGIIFIMLIVGSGRYIRQIMGVH